MAIDVSTTLEMMSGAPTNAGIDFTSNI